MATTKDTSANKTAPSEANKTPSTAKAPTPSELEKKVEAGSEVHAVVPQGAPAVPDATVTAKDPPHLVDLPPGELNPGEIGTVSLDAHGKPVGEPKHHDPSDTQPKAAVRREAPAPEQDIRTPSGAPVTSQMNPDPVATMDPAFLARNPPGGTHDSSQAIAADGPTKGYQDAYDKPPEPYDPNKNPNRKSDK